MAFKRGDAVTQILPTAITGTVTGFALDQESGEVHVKVEYKDTDGNTHERHFKQSELTAAAQAAA